MRGEVRLDGVRARKVEVVGGRSAAVDAEGVRDSNAPPCSRLPLTAHPGGIRNVITTLGFPVAVELPSVDVFGVERTVATIEGTCIDEDADTEAAVASPATTGIAGVPHVTV